MKFFHFSPIILLSLIFIHQCNNLGKNTIRILSECHPNCKECSGPATDSHHMNCLSCQEGFYHYKSNNCLNCSKYINFEQTECIETIPDGYYLENEELGILGKCHELCKTCDGPPMIYGMQCTECKYYEKGFEPTYETDCPDGIEDEEEEMPYIPGEQCPRNKPILIRNESCSMVYCSESEYKDGTCQINNDIVKMQWINNVERFGDGEIGNICLDFGDDGELFLFGQEKDLNEQRWLYIYGIDKNQMPILYNDERKKSYFKKIKIPFDIVIENIKLVKNFENDNLFLITTQINKNMYVIDYINNKTNIHRFNQNSLSWKMSDIILIKKLSDVYLTNFITCKSENNCYGFLRQFKFYTNNNDVILIKEYTLETKLNIERNFICIESYNNYIQCLFTSFEEKKYILELYDINILRPKYQFIIEQDMNKATNVIESMIKLKEDVFIIVYSLEKNLVKILIKTIKYNYYMFALDIYDYITDVPYLFINEKNEYIFEGNNSNRNSLCIINENKFALLLNAFNDLPKNNYENSLIIIYIFSIFNDHKNINVRKYTINFKLYNMVNKGKMLGYTFGNFFGTLMELSSSINKNITNAGFITFGYINNINKEYEIYDRDFFPEKSVISNPIIVKNYLTDQLQNNLFGYSFNGAIILSLIDENQGYFYIGNNYKLIVGQVINISFEIRLEIYHNYTPGNYSIEFAGVAEEPRYDNLDKYPEETLHYPNNTDKTEKDYYKPKILIGKKIIYKFEIKKDQAPKVCYPSCDTCDEFSEDEDNQKCITCREQFYFINGTQNCINYPKQHYYFDNKTQKYYPCFKDCLTCDNKGINRQNMNCLSCTSDFIFYPKGKNCLKCPDFVNYPQTQCISSVPEGFYIVNKTFGIIDQCYHLCKTCSKGPLNDTDGFHMNCDICLYENKNFIPSEQGDCPPSPEEGDGEDPTGEQCSKDFPILKNKKCKAIYCTKKEFEEKTCVIYNDIIKKQWFNNINIFPNEASNVKYANGEKGEIFLIAHHDESFSYLTLDIFGFDKNNEGLFYDKAKKDYSSYKKLTVKNIRYKDVEKVIYKEMNSNPYLLIILKEYNQLYLINLDSNNQNTYTLPHSPSFVDKFEKYINSNNEYFYDYIYCINNKAQCYLGLSKYIINSIYDIKVDKSIEELIRVKPDTKLICINNIFSSIYTLCKYNKLEILDDDETYINKHTLALFDSNTFEMKNSFVLENYFSPEKQALDAMIPLDESKSNFIMAYSTSQNIIKILFKTFKNDYKELSDVIEKVPYININEELDYYFNGNVYTNDLCKIDKDNFFLLLKTHKNKDIDEDNDGLLVVSLKLYKFSKVIVRYYHMDLNLYNINLPRNILGFNFNGFLGSLLDINSKNNEMDKSAFIIFGFVNKTNDVSFEKGTADLIEKKQNLKIKDYILDINNNLFGYEIQGVKILHIPDIYKVGAFFNIHDNNKLININDIIDISSELKFSQVKDPVQGNYSISFIPIIKEPSEQIAINIDDKSEYYPKDSTQYEYDLKSFNGRIFTYNFSVKKTEMKCFQNCEECLFVSDDIQNQNCLKCKSGFYFIHNTKNCFDKIDSKYYFDSDTKQFYPCYKDCYTCNTKEISTSYMNCESCSYPFKYYTKTKNCLNCNYYVNYEQTQCLNNIPEGYYLVDKILGIIDRCYALCKTCSSGEYNIGNELHMNCESCLYKNNSKIRISGNCPEIEEEEDSKSGNTLVIVIVVILSVIVVVVVGVVIYFKCFKNRQINNELDAYQSNEGKNVPFDEDIGIN